MPSPDFTDEDLCSSWMMSLDNSTHSSQMNTVGPAISLRTSCWFLPQNEQKRVFFGSLSPILLTLALHPQPCLALRIFLAYRSAFSSWYSLYQINYSAPRWMLPRA